ncbi:hypothetical protein ABT174_00590 [Streptomyces sparsogenes]|uniref:hypothetical protein n=1 Tax=Streptomyces sparsogenes TaxID=67365 RepID=UPI003327BCC0
MTCTDDISGKSRVLLPRHVIGCFSRRVVGWPIAYRMRADLGADALTAAAHTRRGLAGSVFLQ